ncbi:citrate synthase family protein [Emcibacter sp. SYSU 3D8]|uniref:citrate synthase family protein n=1 Tax=Emcibacter sp. SYSU 3D8 TaxID=3133969 RepID=UPI0031FF1DA1
MTVTLIAAEEVCRRLGIRPQTLYAYVSRGMLDAVADMSDSRRSLYREADVEALAARKKAGRSRPAVAAKAINWGDPVLETQISTVLRGRLIYRGQDAVAWSETATLEETAALLCGVAAWSDAPAPALAAGEAGIAGAFSYLARSANEAPPMFGRSRQSMVIEGAGLLRGVASAVLGRAASGPVHEAAAAAWRLKPRGTDLVRRALVLLADHELNASTFAVRVVGSTGASLPAALMAGLAALTGPRHGGMTMRTVAMFAEALAAPDPAAFFVARLERGELIWGLHHELYPDGDIRARALRAAHEPSGALRRTIDAAEAAGGMALNVDGALAALAHTLGLSQDAAFAIFALGRTAGWIAHAIEQTETGTLIRPRARYAGPAPVS